VAEQNNCVNCRKKTSCRLCYDVSKILDSYLNWFTDPDETISEIEEAIGKQCNKFVENGG